MFTTSTKRFYIHTIYKMNIIYEYDFYLRRWHCFTLSMPDCNKLDFIKVG